MPAPRRHASGKTRIVSLSLAPEEIARLRAAAASRGVSVSALVGAWARRLNPSPEKIEPAETARERGAARRT
jgi:hypothetical protein